MKDKSSATRLLFHLSSFIFLLSGCVSEQGVTYRPAPQILPPHIKKLAIRPWVNKTQQFGLEDKLNLRTVDEFLRDGEFPIGPESEADGVVAGELSRYILTPVTYDTALVPTSYKLTVVFDLKFIDKVTNTELWHEPNFVVSVLYAPPTVPGGKTELQAQQDLWDVVAPQVRARVIQGFGTVTPESQRRIATSTGAVNEPISSTATLPSPTTDQATTPTTP